MNIALETFDTLPAERRQALQAELPENVRQELDWDFREDFSRYAIDSRIGSLGVCVVGVRDLTLADLRIWVHPDRTNSVISKQIIHAVVARLQGQHITGLASKPRLYGITRDDEDYLMLCIPLVSPGIQARASRRPRPPSGS